jgi:hypothetical protein
MCHIQHVETMRCDAMQTQIEVSQWLQDHPAFDLLVDDSHPLQCGKREIQT